MAIKAQNPFEPVWYTPTADKESENPTRFRLRGLDGNIMGYIGPELKTDEHGRVTGITGKGVELTLNYGLIDWENLSDSSGALKFSKARFNRLPYDLRVELVFEILTLSAPDEDQRKN